MTVLQFPPMTDNADKIGKNVLTELNLTELKKRYTIILKEKDNW
jgi:hypothetical protein